MARSLLVGLVALATQADAARKILCLHGGGMSGDSFAGTRGMRDLEASLGPEYEFVYPDAPYGTGQSLVWIRDPPGGKDEPTTDPNWAQESMERLDEIVKTQGPFYGILGYSQGSASVPLYLSHAPEGTFDVAMAFCGYLTETHLGLLDNVVQASPYGGIPALVWMGENDWIISNQQTREQVRFPLWL